ncbi:PREDICTED: uncharacterized protein LOC105327636 [Paramuricea clavata]|uniref:PREDICTED: uncharacterized protein LOC105327636 n=1 Tax=Paramuricea clavata TaxID=317549 RepID=A0A7D9JV80_PARCT|nr:PREDICTED: uncharacterized protein LOC105327636 [Paramuricea clavata]
MSKLYSGDTIVFYTDTPNGLLNKVWFEIMYYLCRRGQENLRAMTTETFDISTDSSGKRYIHQKKDELDKNHRDTSTGAVTQGRMYELPGYGARHIMAISGHQNEASIRSYSTSVSEEQTRRISTSLTLATARKDDDIYQSPLRSNLPASQSPLLSDSDLPSTPYLNQIMNTVLSRVMSAPTEIFKYTKFDGCTININIPK